MGVTMSPLAQKLLRIEYGGLPWRMRSLCIPRVVDVPPVSRRRIGEEVEYHADRHLRDRPSERDEDVRCSCIKEGMI